MRTISVINQKGGCGKTTTSINLAAALADLGHKTLLIDMDPQSHCALGLAVPESQVERSIADALLSPNPARFDWGTITWQVNGNLDLAPSTTHLAAVEHQLTNAPDRDLRLAKALIRVAPSYEFCIIDCPPSIGLLTFNALRAAREVIIPVETGYFALHGAIKQAATLQVLADRVGHGVAFYVLPTMYDTQTRFSDQIVTELRGHFGERVLDIVIHDHAELKAAAGMGQPVSEYQPDSHAAADFRRLAEHLLTLEPGEGRIATPSEAAAIVERATRSMGEPEPVIQVSGFEAMACAFPPVSAQPVPVAHQSGDRLADLLQRAKALSQRTERNETGNRIQAVARLTPDV